MHVNGEQRQLQRRKDIKNQQIIISIVDYNICVMKSSMKCDDNVHKYVKSWLYTYGKLQIKAQ